MNAMRVISFEKLCAIHNQIYRQGTGTPEDFAEKVGLSKSQLGKYLNYFRYDLKVDISYDKCKHSANPVFPPLKVLPSFA